MIPRKKAKAKARKKRARSYLPNPHPVLVKPREMKKRSSDVFAVNMKRKRMWSVI
jgi:hypothetical protein